MQRVSNSVLVLVQAAIFLGNLVVVHSAYSDDIPQNVLFQIQEKVRGAAQKNLTMSEPWQTRLFNDEVLPNAQRFVRNYSSGSSGLTVDIDFESIQKYLTFYAPRVLKRQNPSLVMSLWVDNDCEKCKQAADTIRGMMKSWADHRGFIIKWVGAEDIGDAQLKDKALQSRLSDMAKMWDSAGVFSVEIEQEPIDDVDSVHADEKKFRIRTFFLARMANDPTSEVAKELRHEGGLELIETQAFDSAAVKLVTETFTDLGGRVQAMLYGTPGSDQSELFLEVAGIGDFNQYSKLKDQLQRVLKDAGPLEERKLSRGRVTWAFRSKKNIGQVKLSLLGLAVESGTASGPSKRLSFENQSERTLQLEIR